jgi:hypothetical protein
MSAIFRATTLQTIGQIDHAPLSPTCWQKILAQTAVSSCDSRATSCLALRGRKVFDPVAGGNRQGRALATWAPRDFARLCRAEAKAHRIGSTLSLVGSGSKDRALPSLIRSHSRSARRHWLQSRSRRFLPVSSDCIAHTGYHKGRAHPGAAEPAASQWPSIPGIGCDRGDDRIRSQIPRNNQAQGIAAQHLHRFHRRP